MRKAVRASTAILNSVRAAIGFWKPHDYIKRLKTMDVDPDKGELYLFGVLKENNPDMLREIKTILRNFNGVLEDVAEKDLVAKTKVNDPVTEAWLVFAIEMAAKHGHPYQRTSTTGGLYVLRNSLPEPLKLLTQEILHAISLNLISNDRIVPAKITSKGSDVYLDIPGGELSNGMCDFEAGTFNFKWDDYYYDTSFERMSKIRN